MANPGYPMPPNPNPMMGGPGGPMQMPPPMRPPMPIRRGTSKAVPVVVSAGLAVGVFCGLLFGVGTGKREAHAGTKASNVKMDDSATTPGAAPAGTGVTVAPIPSPAAPVAAGSGSATVAQAPTPPPPAPPPAQTVKTSKLVFDIKPETAAAIAKITVDGKDVPGTTIDLPIDVKNVKVSVKADGFHSFDKAIDLEGDKTTVSVELTKRSGGGAASTGAGSPGFGGASNSTNHVPTRPPGGDGTTPPPPPPKKDKKKDTKPAGGGLIDI